MSKRPRSPRAVSCYSYHNHNAHFVKLTKCSCRSCRLTQAPLQGNGRLLMKAMFRQSHQHPQCTHHHHPLRNKRQGEYFGVPIAMYIVTTSFSTIYPTYSDGMIMLTMFSQGTVSSTGRPPEMELGNLIQLMDTSSALRQTLGNTTLGSTSPSPRRTTTRKCWKSSPNETYARQ